MLKTKTKNSGKNSLIQREVCIQGKTIISYEKVKEKRNMANYRQCSAAKKRKHTHNAEEGLNRNQKIQEKMSPYKGELNTREEEEIDSKRILQRKTEQKKQKHTLSKKRKRRQCYVMPKAKPKKTAKKYNIQRYVYIKG